MPSLNASARPALIPGLLAALACGLAAGDARAVPIPTQITYSTSDFDLSEVRSIPGMYEFHPVKDGVATLGSDLKLGTILVHRQPASQYMPVFAVPLPIDFRVTKFGEDLLPAGGSGVRIDNYVNDGIRNDGTVVGSLQPFVNGPSDPIQVGPLTLALKPVAVSPAWDQEPNDAVVAIDIYARLEGTPVPEPSVLLIFAVAAGLGCKRLGDRESRRP